MELKSLGYVGVSSDRLDDWRSFGPDFLGLELNERSNRSLSFRMDDREQRLIIGADNRHGPFFLGWEVEDSAALHHLAARLAEARVPLSYGSRSLAEERGIRELITFADPTGNRIEVFHGPAVNDRSFRPGRAISGFRTGPLGMGHAVLTVERIADVKAFYIDLLGFRLSDYALRPFKAYFFHLNARHHSLALIETGRNGLHHVMMELLDLDDVGQTYDLAQDEAGRVGATLGRHTNDFMTSFYAHTPSDFMIEYGWGGRDIDMGTWRPHELEHGPSMWGHERMWLPPEQRAEARAMRLRAARWGVRQPVQVIAGHYQMLESRCKEGIAKVAPAD